MEYFGIFVWFFCLGLVSDFRAFRDYFGVIEVYSWFFSFSSPISRTSFGFFLACIAYSHSKLRPTNVTRCVSKFVCALR